MFTQNVRFSWKPSEIFIRLYVVFERCERKLFRFCGRKGTKQIRTQELEDDKENELGQGHSRTQLIFRPSRHPTWAYASNRKILCEYERYSWRDFQMSLRWVRHFIVSSDSSHLFLCLWTVRSWT